MPRPFKFLIGIILLPVCVACTVTVANLLLILWQSPIRLPLFQIGALLGGIVLWLLIFWKLPPLTKTYIFGHELTHALWSILFGGKIRKFHVSDNGGHVRLTKVNFLVTLAPYFFPLYTGIVLLLWLLLRAAWPGIQNWTPLFLFLIGLTWAFHITFTLRFLSWKQPDVKENGRLFSYTLIYAINLLAITSALIPLSSWTYREAAGYFLTTLHTYIDLACTVLLSLWKTIRSLLPQ